VDTPVEILAVAVAAARVQQHHRPAARDQLLVVEVDRVGGAVPGVVRPAVDVEQERLRRGRVRVAHQPAVDDRPVRDRELTLLPREQLDLLGIGAVGGADIHPVPGQVDDGDLPERGRRRDHHRGQGADDRGSAHDRARLGDERPRLSTLERNGVQMRATVIADAEHDVPPVAGDLWESARIAGAAGHHVAVERRREVHRLAVLERDAQEVRVRGEALLRVPGHGENAGPVGCPAGAEGGRVCEGHELRIGLPVGRDAVERRPEDEVAIGGRRGSEGEVLPVRRPGRLAGVQVAARDLPALAGLHLHHVQVHTDAAPDSHAVGLVVDSLGDEWFVTAALPLVGALPRRREQVDGSGEDDPRAVGAPDGPAGAQRQIRQRPRLASCRRQEPELRGPVGGAEKGDRGAVGRPGGSRVGRAGREPLGLAVATADPPQRGDVPVGGRVARPQRVDDLLSVWRERRLLGDCDVVQVVDALASAHGGSSSGSGNSLSCRHRPPLRSGHRRAASLVGVAHKQLRDEGRQQRRALGQRRHDDELSFAMGMVADGSEAV
jgi:hypothetical protein